MRHSLLLLGLLIVSASCSQSKAASPIVIAGSDHMAPPRFQAGPYIQLTPVIDRAHPFTIIDGGAFRVAELQIAAYRSAGIGGTAADFSVHADANGVPGEPLGTFVVAGIPLSTPSVVSASPTSDLVLYSGTTYWIVGTTNQGQVNWSLASGTPGMISVNGPYAYKLRNDDWVVSPTGQLAAYAILGSPVPEPAAGALFLLLSATALTMRRRT